MKLEHCEKHRWEAAVVDRPEVVRELSLLLIECTEKLGDFFA